MNVLIINGNLDKKTGTLQDYLDKFTERRRELGDEIKQITLAGKEIQPCIGCYTCWLKTPGICCLKDDHEEIIKSAVWSDQTIWTSSLSMGFVLSSLKNASDRMLPLVHPFLKMKGDRMSHYPRYEKTIDNILLLEANQDLDESTFNIIADIYRRYKFVGKTDKNPEVVANEAHNI